MSWVSTRSTPRSISCTPEKASEALSSIEDQKMFRSVVLGSNDIERSKTFYDAAMGAVGFPPAEPNERGALIYRRDGSMLIITPPLNGGAATAANGGTIALTLSSE